MRKCFLILSLLCMSSSSQALGNLYCKITSVSEMSKEGAFAPVSKTKGFYAGAVGSDFIIDRSTGLMLGKYVGNDVAGWETKIVDVGSSEMSYKSFSQNRDGFHYAQYIEVNVYADEPKKPFVLVNTKVLTGFCTL